MLRLKLLVVLLLLCPAVPAHAQPRAWRPVHAGILYGISGMALVAQAEGRATFLIVHDNKHGGEGRAALLRLTGRQQPEYVPLNWPAAKLPEDLEGLTAVPGRAGEFMALASAGRVYHIRLDEARLAVEVLRDFDLPGVPAHSNFEGFALQQFGARTLAAWAHRGEGSDPGVLYWGVLDLQHGAFMQVRSTPLIVPWAGPHVRHVADLKVDAAGTAYAVSAADWGDNGPFDSTVYIAGGFQLCEGELLFRPAGFIRLGQFPYHKIEALELVPGATGGLVFGTDDENMGSWVWLDW